MNTSSTKGGIAATPVLTLVAEAGLFDSNPCGYEVVHIYAFNVDGHGSALVTYDDLIDFEYCDQDDLRIFLLGDAAGVRWYRPEGIILG